METTGIVVFIIIWVALIIYAAIITNRSKTLANHRLSHIKYPESDYLEETLGSLKSRLEKIKSEYATLEFDRAYWRDSAIRRADVIRSLKKELESTKIQLGMMTDRSEILASGLDQEKPKYEFYMVDVDGKKHGPFEGHIVHFDKNGKITSKKKSKK